MTNKERFMEWAETYFTPQVVAQYRAVLKEEDISVIEIDNPVNKTGEVKFLIFYAAGPAYHYRSTH